MSASTATSNTVPPALHNFGPVSTRDSLLFTAERPGNPEGKSDTVSDEAVQGWITYVKAQGITHVIALLDDNEFANYVSDLPTLYQAGGLQFSQQPMSAPDAASHIFQIIDQAAGGGSEKVVVHCTGGIGRAGRVAAGWLCHHYGLSPEEATAETMATAKTFGVNRKGDAAALAKWVGK